MKRFNQFYLVILLALSVITYSCTKEKSEDVSPNNVTVKAPRTPIPDGPLVLTGGSYMDPYCTLAHGSNCVPGGFTCLLRFPSEGAVGGGNVGVRFYEPVENGVGQTGFQMAIEFVTHAEGAEDGILGPNEDPAETIEVYQALANALNRNSITIINKEYMPVMDDPDYPHGYVYVDCIVQ